MVEYYSLIGRAVAQLGSSSVESRRRLYERARMAQIKQLRTVKTPMTKREYGRERLALEDAIRKIENVTRIDELNVPQTILQVPIDQTPRPAAFTAAARKGRSTTAQSLLRLLSDMAALFMAGIIIVPCIYLFDSTLLSAKALNYTAYPIDIALVLCIVVFLPLSLFQATRSVSAVGFIISSYIFGASTWMAGMIATIVCLGWFWAFAGLLAFAVGVVPLGITGLMINSYQVHNGLNRGLEDAEDTAGVLGDAVIRCSI